MSPEYKRNTVSCYVETSTQRENESNFEIAQFHNAWFNCVQLVITCYSKEKLNVIEYTHFSPSTRLLPFCWKSLKNIVFVLACSSFTDTHIADVLFKLACKKQYKHNLLI